MAWRSDQFDRARRNAICYQCVDTAVGVECRTVDQNGVFNNEYEFSSIDLVPW